ncbi:hypothetical protein KIV65_gp56 [Mycobacterium phage Anthony]|uniref:Uncharacterized protein n=1 Tax=Mycobacterium phage Anthony TaxID=2599857 RepID=A0A5J6TNV5_9CAUD|nr:hypothetical protein KIV65_gp56 [Mycobacterium phage Anthony]QFG10412.1 hypothetical protein PBI_ANTHONY_41 [Mycobacterium phage Anthony]
MKFALTNQDQKQGNAALLIETTEALALQILKAAEDIHAKDKKRRDDELMAAVKGSWQKRMTPPFVSPYL